ncbi:DUF4328 domain-containing protein [Mycobacterium sp.]|uniref:DUF4328 domain-containing protein n=1 Tax=Mycobacterium sp. TaxID=1785 RepID=UPI0025FE9167|nr:DUF4328 domain-containing protein [Mycobacterium sp.]
MIQVCSQCGTRWNVRDKQRSWCPRCNGTLLAPAATEPAPPTTLPSGWGTGPRTAPRLPPGYRWIAVRPGPPPPPRRPRRPLGPTPRYLAIPRWGLRDQVDQDGGPGREQRQAPPPDRVRSAFLVSAVALGVAALVHVLRYLLLVINRNTLLNWLVADAAALLSVLASLAAVAAVMTTAFLLTRWLIARRAAAFEHAGLPESRSRRALWTGTLLPPFAAMALAIIFAVVGATTEHLASWALMAACLAFCCLPLLGSVWALVYVIELAKTEDHYSQMRPVIWSWWLIWLVSTLTSVFASITSGAPDAQGIANNTVAMIVAYLVALAATLVTAKLYEGFERKPVERPAHRWVVVSDADENYPVGGTESAAAVELPGEEPAA